MKLNQKQRRIFSVLFLMGYIFVAFFAQQFHDHEHHSDFNKTEKAFTQAMDNDASDCLACHLLYEGKHLSTEDFSLDFIANIVASKVQIESVLQQIIRPKLSKSLRAPPVFA